MQRNIAGTLIELMQGDITDMEVDAIVNAANSSLILGAGVAGAIRSRGGPSIQVECDKIGHTPVGSAAITGAGDLKANYIIHAVGPRKGEGDEGVFLRSAVTTCMELADENDVYSIAFPAISAGIFGVSIETVAPAITQAIASHCRKGTNVKEVYIVLWGDSLWADFEKAIQEA